jgi:hypothetical protein
VYILMPLLAPLVLLAVLGMAWVEDHLLPPAEGALKPTTNPAARRAGNADG